MVKSNAQNERELILRAEIVFLGVGWGGQCPNSLFPNFWHCLKRVKLGS